MLFAAFADLADEGLRAHVLVDHLDASKSTVYKGVSQLQERRLIESTQDGLQLMLFGIIALRQYDELARTADLGGLLARLPPDAIDPSAPRSRRNDTEVCIELGEEGHVSGLLINDTAECLHWAETEFEHYKQNAVRITT